LFVIPAELVLDLIGERESRGAAFDSTSFSFHLVCHSRGSGNPEETPQSVFRSKSRMTVSCQDPAPPNALFYSTADSKSIFWSSRFL